MTFEEAAMRLSCFLSDLPPDVAEGIDLCVLTLIRDCGQEIHRLRLEVGLLTQRLILGSQRLPQVDPCALAKSEYIREMPSALPKDGIASLLEECRGK